MYSPRVKFAECSPLGDGMAWSNRSHPCSVVDSVGALGALPAIERAGRSPPDYAQENPRYQNGQLPGAATSIRRAWPAGTKKTATISACSTPSFRRMCGLVPSMKLMPAVYVCPVQVGSSPLYAVTAPDLTSTNTGPGCACQPVVPPFGSATPSVTWMSVSWLVFSSVSN